MHWVFKEDWGFGGGLGASASLGLQCPLSPQSRLGGHLLRRGASCTLQKSTSAWIVRMRWSSFALSVRSVCFEGILDLAACLSS
jgi:hypothetical protein